MGIYIFFKRACCTSPCVSCYSRTLGRGLKYSDQPESRMTVLWYKMIHKQRNVLLVASDVWLRWNVQPRWSRQYGELVKNFPFSHSPDSIVLLWHHRSWSEGQRNINLWPALLIKAFRQTSCRSVCVCTHTRLFSMPIPDSSLHLRAQREDVSC